MFVLRGVLALSLVFSLCAYNLPLYASGGPLGILTLAYGAHLNASDAFAGLSIFDGERLSTDAEGKLSARIGGSVITLIGQSAATLQRSGDGAHIDLDAGTVYVWSAASNQLEVHAEGALLRPHGGTRYRRRCFCLRRRFCRLQRGRAAWIFCTARSFALCRKGRRTAFIWNRRMTRGRGRTRQTIRRKLVYPLARRWRISFWRGWAQGLRHGGFTI